MSSAAVPVTAMIFTLDEEMHLPSCLASLAWCDDVIVVDSYSSDGTVRIASGAGARVFQRKFDGFGTQRNWALEQTGPRHPWVLILDADERVPPEMVDELRSLLPSIPERFAAFRVARRFYFWGCWLRYSSLYPTYVVRLVRAGRVRYVNRGHAESQVVDGDVGQLRTDLIDENRKGMEEWFERQNRYSSRDAEYELDIEQSVWRVSQLWDADPLVRRAGLKRLAAAMPGRPVWYFLYSYVVRGGFLDGKVGLVFCIMKAMYQLLVAAKKHELRMARAGR
jgi:glycosyltransferase involved in cell wall biosynthesis